MAPGLLSKAEGIAAQALREMRQETVVLRFNEDLDICGPNQKEAFKVTITPAMVLSLGCIGVAAVILAVWWKWMHEEHKWDPFGIGNLNFNLPSVPSFPKLW